MKNSGLFGSEKTYKMLGYIHDNFDSLNKNERRRVTNIINNFDVAIKGASEITNSNVQMRFLNLLRNETTDSLVKLKSKYSINKTYVDYLLNFTNARVKNIIKTLR